MKSIEVLSHARSQSDPPTQFLLPASLLTQLSLCSCKAQVASLLLPRPPPPQPRRRRHHTPPLRSPDGRKERSTVGSGAADADGRTRGGTREVRMAVDETSGRATRRERCGSHGLISHLGVTRGRGAVPPLKRRRGVLCSLSPSPSPSRPLSLPLSLCRRRPTGERVSFTCSRKLMCGVRQRSGRSGRPRARGRR